MSWLEKLTSFFKRTGSGTIEYYIGSDNKWYYRVRSVNNEILVHSQGYQTKQGCKKGIRALLNSCNNPEEKQVST